MVSLPFSLRGSGLPFVEGSNGNGEICIALLQPPKGPAASTARTILVDHIRASFWYAARSRAAHVHLHETKIHLCAHTHAHKRAHARIDDSSQRIGTAPWNKEPIDQAINWVPARRREREVFHLLFRQHEIRIPNTSLVTEGRMKEEWNRSDSQRAKVNLEKPDWTPAGKKDRSKVRADVGNGAKILFPFFFNLFRIFDDFPTPRCMVPYPFSPKQDFNKVAWNTESKREPYAWPE